MDDDIKYLKMSMLQKLWYSGTACLELASASHIFSRACLPLDNSLKEIS